MGKTVTTKYDIGDKVWWRWISLGKAYSGEIESIEIQIVQGIVSVGYIVNADESFVKQHGLSRLKVYEEDIFKKEDNLEVEVEKE